MIDKAWPWLKRISKATVPRTIYFLLYFNPSYGFHRKANIVRECGRVFVKSCLGYTRLRVLQQSTRKLREWAEENKYCTKVFFVVVSGELLAESSQGNTNNWYNHCIYTIQRYYDPPPPPPPPRPPRMIQRRTHERGAATTQIAASNKQR